MSAATACMRRLSIGIEDFEDVNNINDKDSTEDIEESNFEGLEYIFNNLPEANKVQEYLLQL
ncbi:hypothetical protein GLOIN_2v1782944 [Rhizophagus irregularis DAOM 181602=DAOM 197198]|uniref:Uncharacterized protein n=1 Tax=Rhizophagus irregularis (strain DAOM 181602 / DAOM 197198 / MUCL 43194) TaxID=747089 RepID=U9UZX3_RHIID|nr:hypothetical protein GLOIN_2v1782944 [Rhizophagus irregularis DAOM 181602=DAOM 197198]POG64432.1 hypothetical protein GLOIN_2v1782944 [Rhizophagus irregularis DAOM 181602=DAOM 197198]GBC28080.1 hypothetical protein GLOIN_2v1782944 [Rhizophagus irregularis DAOM 181602=DAOM 197198]CAG8694072.1 8012_t:CDS:2 [Rhizophagus irregularis]|eukprot:XP_025171298.1 hypothetical protein GLOIN_2v1782944 [Rhizophagus irregularis DAOM 181602=DAOM 197198]